VAASERPEKLPFNTERNDMLTIKTHFENGSAKVMISAFSEDEGVLTNMRLDISDMLDREIEKALAVFIRDAGPERLTQDREEVSDGISFLVGGMRKVREARQIDINAAFPAPSICIFLDEE
jgi:hypothetical protein